MRAHLCLSHVGYQHIIAKHQLKCVCVTSNTVTESWWLVGWFALFQTSTDTKSYNTFFLAASTHLNFDCAAQIIWCLPCSRSVEQHFCGYVFVYVSVWSHIQDDLFGLVTDLVRTSGNLGKAEIKNKNRHTPRLKNGLLQWTWPGLSGYYWKVVEMEIAE